jgi:predicted nuclease with RNAse H fold
MLTLGVDLSSQDRNTAICLARWNATRCDLERLDVGVGNDEIVELMLDADATGIDAPFGWPDRFVAAVTGWMADDVWSETWDDDTRRLLRLRETDRWLQRTIRKWPLSVSADSIAMCAMRAVTLLRAASNAEHRIERVRGPYFEVYPGAALIAWDLAAVSTGYKRLADSRERLVEAIAPPGGWLVLTPEQRAKLVATDHSIDALLAALVARAAAIGGTELPPEDLDASVIAREGWIQLPKPGTLAGLARSRASR